MRFLESFVETRIAGAIGWTLLHSLWQGAIVSVVFAVVLLALPPGAIRRRLRRDARDAHRIRAHLTAAAEQASSARNVHAPVFYLAKLSRADLEGHQFSYSDRNAFLITIVSEQPKEQ